MTPVRLILAATAALLLGVGHAQAQPVQAKTVSACGTPGNTPVVGSSYPITMDATGKLCTDGSGGGGVSEGTATAAAPSYVEGTDNPISLDLHGSTRTTILDASGSAVDWTAPVPVTQSGTWTVQPGNTANTTPWLVTGSGTAGTAAAGVLTVQGIASMTPVQVSQATASNLNAQVVGPAASGAAASGNPVPIGGDYNSTLPTLTNGQRGQLQMGTRGALNVTLFGADVTSAIDSQSSGADASSNSRQTLTVTNRNAVFNGSTWDRVRGIAGSFGAATGVTAVEQAGATFAYIGTATTTQVKSGTGILHKVIVNTCVAAATIDLIDNTSGSTINIGRITCPATVVNPFELSYDLGFTTGLRVITSGATDVTVVYR